MTSLRRIATLLESFEPMSHVEPETLADAPRKESPATEEPAALPLDSTLE